VPRQGSAPQLRLLETFGRRRFSPAESSPSFAMQTDALALVPSLASWQCAVPAEQPTENMMKWMRHYAQPCPLLCCRSPDCATIQCSSCSKSLTSAIGSLPALRYECGECDPVGCETFTPPC
jgi:hypothetical protein